MLCYNGLGNEKLAKQHEVRYMRFKADESSQAITGPYRQLHPEDNNERQAIHEHVSVQLPVVAATHLGTAAPVVLPGNARSASASTALTGASR
jgi:hypothetical protein